MGNEVKDQTISLHMETGEVEMGMGMEMEMGKKRRHCHLLIGIPSAPRRNATYLNDTLNSLVMGLDEEDYDKVCIHVLVFDRAEAGHGESSGDGYGIGDGDGDGDGDGAGFHGLVSITRAKLNYSKLENLVPTFGDDDARMYWRSKQNLDYAALMRSALGDGDGDGDGDWYGGGYDFDYFLMLEDDVFASRGYYKGIVKALDFVGDSDNEARHPHPHPQDHLQLDPAKEWGMLDFTSFGFVGKLFRASDIARLASFLEMYYDVMPCDWLLPAV